MTFSADTSVFQIITTFLQPFELAVLTGEHTAATYLNAAAFGKSNCPNRDLTLKSATAAGQLDAMRYILDMGSLVLDWVFAIAAQNNQIDAAKLLVSYGARGFTMRLNTTSLR